MSDNSISAGIDAAAAISKSDAGQEATPSSLESTPEPDTEIVQDPAQPQKRKGGRKPIYATSEERKQRNRQAQAAFRERRTEYIKQLETTIKHHEETLQSLQQSHRSAADECLMLRYKNSLLERILLEKGIDVQSELQLKTGSPALGPAYMPHAAPAPAPMMSAGLQRTAMNRQHARRSGQTFPQRMGPGPAPPSEMTFSARSPQGHPTPSSHASSPTAISTQSPASMQQGGMTPPAPVVSGQQQYAPHRPSGSRYVMQHPPQRPPPPTQYSHSNGVSSMSTGGLNDSTSGAHGAPTTYYPSPFQKHIDQLEQEYDAQPSSILEAEREHDTIDQPGHHSAEHGQYSQQQYHNQLPPHGMQQRPGQQPRPKLAMPDHERSQQTDSAGQIPGMNQIFDPYDPMLDADPFGLSASMHFPTNYSFEQPPAQR